MFKFKKLNLSVFQVCFIVFILVALLFLGLSITYKDSLIELFSDNKGTLFFFHASWCPHCIKALPEFNKCKASLEKNGYEAKAIEQKQFKEDEDYQKYKDFVKGFPTILRVDSKGNVFPYNGPRIAASMTEFMTQ